VSNHAMTYIHIPVSWQKPEIQNFAQFSSILKSLRKQKVYVHCQGNLRASTFVFLYRVIHEHIPAQKAINEVDKVWQPKKQWVMFINDVLKQSNIEFDYF